jgi:sulfate adenylyltransferase subunit 2
VTGAHEATAETEPDTDTDAAPDSETDPQTERTPTKESGMTVLTEASSRLWQSHLDSLESESVHIFRETAAEFERPVLLFSGGKDSIVMLHLAVKAFWPAPVPFGLLHVDTGHNFDEVIEYRDRVVAEHGLRLTVANVQDYIDDGRLRERPDGTRNPLQTVPLLDAITDGKFDAVFGGGRRDEEKARAKERVFSLRDEFGGWDPRRQRPELWQLYNGRHRVGEHVRVFPLSNWTELDVWQYIEREGIELPEIYFAHERDVFARDGMWLTAGAWGGPKDGETVEHRMVRYRTVGDMSCTGAVDSDADTIAQVIREIAASTLTERGATRADDKLSEAAMEDRKREGYF